MKSEADVRKSYRARFNQLKSAARELRSAMHIDPDELSGHGIADMRSAVEDITQAFHEFNAYWNVYHGPTEQEPR